MLNTCFVFAQLDFECNAVYVCDGMHMHGMRAALRRRLEMTIFCEFQICVDLHSSIRNICEMFAYSGAVLLDRVNDVASKHLYTCAQTRRVCTVMCVCIQGRSSTYRGQWRQIVTCQALLM